MTWSRKLALAAALTALFHTVAFAWAWPYIMDDALTTYRYARHIGQGLGPIWNLSGAVRHVEGYSSILHVFLLGGLYALTRVDVEILGKTLGLAFILTTIACVAFKARRTGLSTGACVVALSPFWLPPLLMATASGMETTLLVLLAWLTPFAALGLVEHEKPRGGIVVFVGLALLGTLTRPEFALNAIGLFAFVAWRRPELRRSLVMAVAFLYVLPGLALTGWRFWTYGDVLPNTFYVKQRPPSQWDMEGLEYVGRFLLVCGLPYLLLAGTAARRLWIDRRDLVLVVLGSVAPPCLYFPSTRPMMMGWWHRFLIPQLPLLAWLAAVAVSVKPAAGAGRLVRGMRVTAIAALLLSALAQVPPILNMVGLRHADDVRLGEVGRRLRPWAAPDRWLSYFDIGRLPYEAEWNVIDVVGLTTHKQDLHGDCGNATDLLLRSHTSPLAVPPEEIVNPCEQLYEPLVELEFLVEPPLRLKRMRVFARRGLPYRESLRAALVDGWPAPYEQPAGWISRYTEALGGLFGH